MPETNTKFDFFLLSLANLVKTPVLFFSLPKQGVSYKNILRQRMGGEGEEKGLFSV